MESRYRGREGRKVAQRLELVFPFLPFKRAPTALGSTFRSFLPFPLPLLPSISAPLSLSLMKSKREERAGNRRELKAEERVGL